MKDCYGCKHFERSSQELPCKYCSRLPKAYEIIDRFEPEEEGESNE